MNREIAELAARIQEDEVLKYVLGGVLKSVDDEEFLAHLRHVCILVATKLLDVSIEAESLSTNGVQ